MTEPADAGDTAGPAGGPSGGQDGDQDAAGLPSVTPAARALFAEQLAPAERYARLLASTGIAHGHLGPREVPRLWDRHLANCAVVTDLVPRDVTVVDVGSGAGLPGLPMALRRPDLRLVLVEPMLRRAAFLERTVGDLELAERVQVIRARAEEPSLRAALGAVSWVTARAVAPLTRLLGWCLPLVGPGGQVLALKGSTASEEVAQFRTAAPQALRAAVADVEVVELGAEYGMEPTQVIRVERNARSEARRRRSP